MKAKLLVSTAFLAASVSLSAQKSATITLHADQGKRNYPQRNLRSVCRTFGFMYLRRSLGRREFGYS